MMYYEEYEEPLDNITKMVLGTVAFMLGAAVVGVGLSVVVVRKFL